MFRRVKKTIFLNTFPIDFDLFRQKSVRVDYLVQSLSSNINVNNLIPPPNSAFDQLYGIYVNVSFIKDKNKEEMNFFRQVIVFRIKLDGFI